MKDASDRSRIVGIAVGCAALLGGMMAVMVGTTETATFHVRRVTQVRLAAGHRNPGNDRKRRQLVRDTYPNRKGFVHEIPGFQLCTCPAGDAGARAIDWGKDRREFSLG